MLNCFMPIIYNNVLNLFSVHFYEFEMNLMNIKHPKTLLK
jgi:hypothetical protein